MKKILFSTLVALCVFVNVKAQSVDELPQLFDESCARGDFKQAFAYAQKWFEQTYAMGPALLMADMYLEGLGVDKNPQKAKETFKIIADVPIENLSSDMDKNIAAYANRMYCSLEWMSYADNHNYTKADFAPLFKAVDINQDPYSAYLIGLGYFNGQLEGGNDEKALLYFNMAAKKNCIPALETLGEYYDEIGDEDKALEYFSKAAQCDIFDSSNSGDLISMLTNPNNANNPEVVESWNEAVFNIASKYVKIDDTAEALTWLDKLTIETPEYLNLKAECYIMEGYREKGIEMLHRSLALKDDSKVYDLMGMLYASWGNEEEARKNFNIAIKKGNPNAAEHMQKMLSE